MLAHNFREPNRKYLLIPSVPTPNGRLHLGHIGGPYLSADIFARHMQRFGHDAHIIAGTDSYESYVTAKADQEQKTPAEVCHYYHHLILQDLQTFHIQTSAMINPLAEEWKARYENWQIYIFELLNAHKAISLQSEKILWNVNKKRYETGCWLKGKCADCKADVTGYFCENCGAHFRPEQIHLSDEFKQTHFNEDEVTNLYMQLPNAINLTSQGISTKINDAFTKFSQSQHGLFRLTANEDWGIKLPAKYHIPGSTLFNYGLMFSYFLLMGEIFGEITGSGRNAFAYDSDVITLSSFGFDNAVPFLASILGITTHCKIYKPFDYYLVNCFYFLDGQKFSTSRNHAIWVSDIDQKDNYAIDIARLFLAEINVRENTGNVNSLAFRSFIQQMSEWINNHVLAPLTVTNTNHQVGDLFTDNLIENIKHQQITLAPNQFSPHLVVQQLFKWQRQMENINHTSADYMNWLKGYAFLVFPFMPNLSEHIWQNLGCEGKPHINAF